MHAVTVNNMTRTTADCFISVSHAFLNLENLWDGICLVLKGKWYLAGIYLPEQHLLEEHLGIDCQ